MKEKLGIVLVAALIILGVPLLFTEMVHWEVLVHYVLNTPLYIVIAENWFIWWSIAILSILLFVGWKIYKW